tara:strand:+ start:18 stop:599 length:582 start_codon:yes stop_codon:yes gene_type:complete
MISNELKCIFIHCQKCAGESIEKALKGSPDKNYAGDPFEGSPLKHANINYFKRNHSKYFEDYFKFSVVRNPWDRFISWVKYRDLRHNLYNGELTYNILSKELKNKYIRKNTFTYLLNLKSKKDIDFIAKFETLNVDFKYICKRLCINATLPHINQSSVNKIHYSNYYNEKLIDEVYKVFKSDINFFGYEFEKK